ncbi:DUF423 domain-containing protein [Methylicorpusculum sp.]|uniref:DUF423 domain-containing protein n=1 Tax=Methylicorpusculum sp. TaxID=2713644 RepID=UPI002716DFC5|nr:DUF423 domain-containing protein [Methylicorpusculum sp.]MDO8843909.1 DUF423 domain-containing protein [Methylicorpusculum sp.]
MRSVFLFVGSFSAFTGVAFGAFGAHALKNSFSPEMLDIYKTGVSYQMWHALGLFGLAFLQQQAPFSRLIHWAGWLMFGGIILFSGSLYLLTILNAKWLGMITPFGGLAFLAAWVLVMLFAAQKSS